MARCASCGQPLDSTVSPAGCRSCASGALTARAGKSPDTPPRRSGSARPNETPPPDSPSISPERAAVVMRTLAELRAFAAIIGEQLGDREVRVGRALARGNDRPYRAELNRLAGRYVERIEQTWV